MPQCLKPKLMPLHVHAHPTKRYTFHAQAKFLFVGVFSAQLDGAARTDHAVPGQARNLLEDSNHLTGRSGPARGSGYGSVGRHGSRRQSPNAAYDAGTLIFFRLRRLRLRRASRGLDLSRLYSSRSGWSGVGLRWPIHGSLFSGRYLPNAMMLS